MFKWSLYVYFQGFPKNIYWHSANDILTEGIEFTFYVIQN